jgi:small GTP-binding protein
MTVSDLSSLAKVLVVGACEVGKTSLVNRFVFRDFVEVSPTVGVNLAHKVCNGSGGPLKLTIWDLSGHPRFSPLMPRFCNGAVGVMVVFDLTDPSSLEAAATWLKHIRSFPGLPQEYVVMLVGNKADLPRKVSQEVIDRFCAAHGITEYLPCSAKSGENVTHVFRTLCSVLQDCIPGLTEEPSIPSS